MKTNNKLQRNLAKFLGIFALTALLTSCGSYYVYYNDGIYGELPPERVTIVERYDNYPSRNTSVPQSKYRDYFREKALQYSDTQESFTHFTDVDSYTSDFYTTNPERKAYAGWGNNPTQVTVNVYDNNWGYPYHRYNSYWGYGAWYPYDNYYYGYYPYHRNHFNWGVSIGWGNYYNPYWNWYDRYGYYDRGYYPYYGYGYYPYYGYGRRYYSRDYYYSPNNSYNRGYNNQYYDRRGRAIVRDNSRRGDANRYYNYENSRNSQGYYNRETAPSGRYENRSGNYNNRNNNYNNSRNDLPTRGYENRNYNNSSRSYENSSSRGYNNSGSSGNSGNSGSSGSGGSGGSHRSSNRR